MGRGRIAARRDGAGPPRSATPSRRAWVEVEHHRSLAGRIAGRPGRPVAVVVHGDDRRPILREGARGATEAAVHQVVRGVVISRRTVAVDEWLQTLAEDLTRLAARDAAARAAPARLPGGA